MRRFALLSVLILAPLASYACRIYEPTNRTVDRCHERCLEVAKRQCSDDECWRGCEFILDRLVEREGKNVLACVANGNRRCTDVVWSDCASKVGFHADGGPPGPAPPVEED